VNGTQVANTNQSFEDPTTFVSGKDATQGIQALEWNAIIPVTGGTEYTLSLRGDYIEGTAEGTAYGGSQFMSSLVGS
jgi:hypothetical protein